MLITEFSILSSFRVLLVYRDPDGDVGDRDVEPRDLPPQPRHLLLPVLRLLPLHQSQLSIVTVSQLELSIITISQSEL